MNIGRSPGNAKSQISYGKWNSSPISRSTDLQFSILFPFLSERAGLLEIRLHQPDPFKSGQRSHFGIYFAHERAGRRGGKQRHEQSFELGLTFDSAVNRRPVEFEQLSGQNPRPAGFQQQLARVIVIPGEMPALLFGYPLAKNFENRIASVFPEVFVP